VLLPIAAVVAARRPLPGSSSSVPVLTLAAGLYVMNWWNVLGAPGIGTGYLGHTWSLAIEEQFHLRWPLCLSSALQRWQPARLARSLVGLVLGLAAVRSALADHGAATEFLTPFRLDGLLLGAALSLLTGGRGVVPLARTALGGRPVTRLVTRQIVLEVALRVVVDGIIRDRRAADLHRGRHSLLGGAAHRRRVAPALPRCAVGIPSGHLAGDAAGGGAASAPLPGALRRRHGRGGIPLAVLAPRRLGAYRPGG